MKVAILMILTIIVGCKGIPRGRRSAEPDPVPEAEPDQLDPQIPADRVKSQKMPADRVNSQKIQAPKDKSQDIEPSPSNVPEHVKYKSGTGSKMVVELKPKVEEEEKNSKPAQDDPLDLENKNSNDDFINKSEEDKLKKIMDEEIDEYVQIRERIQFLEEHLKSHADFNVIPTSELLSSAHDLQDIKDKIIKPLENNLIAVRKQLDLADAEHHKISKDERDFISSVIKNADDFLKSSSKKIQNLEFIEEAWESEEEAQKIKDATGESKDSDDNFSSGSPLIRAMSKSLENMQAGGVRSNRLPKIHKKVQNAMRKKNEMMKTGTATGSLPGEENMEIVTEKIKIDIQHLKADLEREKMMDESPGYAKKIKSALKQAADMSHKFLDDKMGHHKQSDGDDRPSWMLVVALGVMSALLLLILLFVLFIYRGQPKRTWKRNLFKGDNGKGYCELNIVKGDSGNGIHNQWNDSGWTTWDQRNAQKLK
eukprot:TRINITY_DN683_c0_g2_i1.p1 TRINITY_DN683_c0_g2~~TRINITY_DN683_c0_g2_i1.p1  ORF type:complete len:481 (+),score=69.59 TRINITY_DN683_c0_g2_i1:49-1491(+)